MLIFPIFPGIFAVLECWSLPSVFPALFLGSWWPRDPPDGAGREEPLCSSISLGSCNCCLPSCVPSPLTVSLGLYVLNAESLTAVLHRGVQGSGRELQ